VADFGTSNNSVSLSDLTPNTEYVVTITATNLTGSTQPKSITVTTTFASTTKTITIVDLSGSTFTSGDTITLVNYDPLEQQTKGNYTFTLENATEPVSWTNILTDNSGNTLTGLPGFTFSNSSSSEILDINIDQTATNMFYRQAENVNTSFTVTITATDATNATGTCSLIFYIQDSS
jgi:hypothetical protein